MNKQLSIKQVSRFVVGAGILRDMAMAKASNTTITSDNIAALALSATPEGSDLRASIAKLADAESQWFRNTPAHVLATETVMTTRELEIAALNSMALAQMAVLEFGDQAVEGDMVAKASILDPLKTAMRGIYEARVSGSEKKALLVNVRDQTLKGFGPENEAFAVDIINESQNMFLSELSESRMAQYQAPAKSDDLDLSPD